MKLAMHRTGHQVQPAQDLVRKIQTPIFENVHLDSLSERSSGGCSVAGQQHHSVKLGWLSDIHLNFLGAAGRSRFFDDLPRHDVDAWILSGDIGDARTVIPYLEEFEQLPARIFFVLGNHDFYHGSIRQVSANVRRLCADNERLVWLTDASHVELGDGTAIIGDDGWSDGRLGNAISTPVDLNDFHLIEELEGHDRQTLVDRLNRLGDEAAERLRPKLLEAAARHATVLVVTH